MLDVVRKDTADSARGVLGWFSKPAHKYRWCWTGHESGLPCKCPSDLPHWIYRTWPIMPHRFRYLKTHILVPHLIGRPSQYESHHPHCVAACPHTPGLHCLVSRPFPTVFRKEDEQSWTISTFEHWCSWRVLSSNAERFTTFHCHERVLLSERFRIS